MQLLDSSTVVGKPRVKKLIIVSLLVVAILSLRTSPSQAVSATLGDHQSSSTVSATLDRLNNYPTLDTLKRPSIYAGEYLLIDAETGEIILGKNFTTQQAVASTTKMTTALVARAVYKLDDVLTVKSGPYIDGSKVGLYVGETMTVESLLKGLMIQSGNDAAVTLAEGLSTESGDTAEFVTKMNEYLSAHHINHSKFVDPAGLNDEGQSTAFDLAQIGRLLMRDEELASIVRIAQTTISSADGKYTHELKNSNRLILSDSEYYLPGVSGIKTGFTYAAGHCLVSAYTINDRQVIAVVLNTAESSITASAEESYKLLTWASLHLSYKSY